MEKSILDLIYLSSGIFITDAEFEDDNLGIVVTCFVSGQNQYSIKPVPYVTTENYVRCLSQASFLLTKHIFEHKLISLDLPVKTFIRVATSHELYYRNLSMTFHSRVEKDAKFKMRLVLKNFREIKRLQDFILFTFANTRTVISGEMSFVFVK